MYSQCFIILSKPFNEYVHHDYQTYVCSFPIFSTGHSLVVYAKEFGVQNHTGEWRGNFNGCQSGKTVFSWSKCSTLPLGNGSTISVGVCQLILPDWEAVFDGVCQGHTRSFSMSTHRGALHSCTMINEGYAVGFSSYGFYFLLHLVVAFLISLGGQLSTLEIIQTHVG